MQPSRRNRHSHHPRRQSGRDAFPRFRSPVHAAAALVWLAFLPLPDARADIVYSGGREISIPADFDGVYLDIDGGGDSQPNPVTGSAPFTGWDVNFFFGGLGIAGSPAFQPAREDSGNESTVLVLALDDPVDSGLAYSTGSTGSDDHLGGAGHFQEGVPGYLGFRFQTNDSTGPFYGWMRVTLTANTAGAVIHDWAWDNTGAAIPAGALPVPEPLFPLPALFLATILFRRHRRRAN
ncbi:MAG: hypothetical protein V4726_25170 [Verrucomicrobiota bacterium]